MRERLWSPWRMEYIKSGTGDEQGCIFCELPAKGDDEAVYIVARGARSFAILNTYPYNSGHLMVAPFRHVGELEELTDEESLDSQHLIQRSIAALKETMEPDGFNLGVNLGRVAGAGVPGHLHWHVVPRWSGDTNFMPVLGETKVLPELLEESWKKLVGALRA
jgi:ATP adenylyltransferase